MIKKVYLPQTYRIGTLVVCLLTFALSSGCALKQQLDESDSRIRYLEAQSASARNLSTEVFDSLRSLQEQQVELLDVIAGLEQKLDDIEAISTPLPAGPAPLVEAPPVLAVQAIEQVSVNKTVLGRIEWIWLPTQKRHFSAVIDTALKESLICAKDLKRFERDGKKWLQFTLNRNDWSEVLEAQVVGSEKISYLSGLLELKGYVIRMPIELGSFKELVEFTVVERKSEKQLIVLGRNFLTDLAVVDVAERFIYKRDAENENIESLKLQQFRLKQETALSSPAPIASKPPVSTKVIIKPEL